MIAGEWRDVLTGKRPDRPGYQALLAAARTGEVQAVLVWRLDRFGRNLRESVTACSELDELRVEVHSVREGHMSAFIRNILLTLAEEESRRIGERVFAAQHFLASQGWWLGRTPLGYRPLKTPDEQGKRHLTLEPDPDIAPLVQELFRRYGTGEYTLGRLLEWLNTLPTDQRGGRLHHRSTILRTLRNPVYKGIARWNLRRNINNQRLRMKPQQEWIEVPGRWLPLVDDETWATVQQVLDSQTVLPRQATGHWLLTGFLRCPRCGARMYGKGHGSGPSGYYSSGKRRTAYRCHAAIHFGTCKQQVTGGPVERAVLEKVQALLLALDDPVVLRAARKRWDRERHGAQAAITQRRTDLERQQQHSAELLKRAAYKLVADDLDAAGYKAIREEQQAVLSRIERELAELRQTVPEQSALPPLDKALRELGGWSAVLDQADAPAQRRLLALLIRTVVPRRVGYGKYEADIEWTPIGTALAAAAGI